MNTEIQDNSKSTSLIEYKEVDNTPFTLIVSEDKVCIVMGKHLVTNRTFKSEDEAVEYINKKDWQLLLTAGAIYAMEILDINKSRV